jgi:hypothetical protein
MIICAECGTENYPGALFCLECGAPLHPVAQTIGRPIFRQPSPAEPPSELEQPLLLSKELLHPGNGEKRLRLTIPSSQEEGLELALSGSEIVWIGRAESKVVVRPEIDLTPYQGYERGVSRRHATVEFCAPGVVLTDRNSSNGTRLNGHRLQPGEPYLLPDKAQVQFGNLLVYLTIED